MVAIAGLLLAWIAVFSGLLVGGSQVGSMSNLPAAWIVLGGTLAAGMIEAKVETWQSAWRVFPQIFWPEKHDAEQTVVKLVRWCQIARRHGPLSLDAESGKEPDHHIRLGLQAIVDGQTPEKLVKGLTISTESRESEWLRSADFFSALGSYATAIGVIGSVVGVIQALANSSDAASFAVGLATAMMSLLYGMCLSNLLFLPVAGRLRSMTLSRSQFDELVLDGLSAILEGEHPRLLERRLREYRL